VLVAPYAGMREGSMKSFTAAEIGQHCNANKAAAHEISEYFRWDFEQWRTKLLEHINLPRAQNLVPNLELRQIEQVDSLRLNAFITDESIHSVDAAAIIGLTVQTHVLGHLLSWLETSKIDEQQFPDAVVLRWCKRNNLIFQDTATKAAPVAGPPSDLEWVKKAQSRANEIIKRQRKLDLYPNQIAIADEIANEFRAACIFGADDKPLSGAYIKRHALKGITSAQDKQKSTTISRGK
jgi:hypothetical protein